jgi:hypothetical protein
MTQLVAVRTDEITLPRLLEQARQRAVEFPQPEVFGRRIAVMELERFNAR